ncbi:CRISPR-associated protein Cas4 [Lentzea tibetensis]|uniref:CRISPR-associated exonuclease Cas4 n=1 Tax=Lentzea tibetensis TaxID=2591470 RepID=A0A563EVL4_9PSEU|nr:CRISPR-associated protein Cas4 [Lentzea tibetensis]TWP51726.1 CRISPR-associated protein Cas4 [Lentzea tibetensis]
MTDATRDGRRSVPISALEHYVYCPRQAALIHVEAYFDSNIDTVRGDLAHAAVDRAGAGQDRRMQRVWRSLPVWSDEVGVHGICDVVQFGDTGPIPIEHKSGTYRPGGPADVQVAAQVLCLREMFDAAVPIGVLFSNRDRRRHDVVVDTELADRVKVAAQEVRRLLDTGSVPAPVNDTRCRRCSLRPGCMPEAPTHVTHALFEPRPAGAWEWE